MLAKHAFATAFPHLVTDQAGGYPVDAAEALGSLHADAGRHLFQPAAEGGTEPRQVRSQEIDLRGLMPSTSAGQPVEDPEVRSRQSDSVDQSPTEKPA